VDDLQFSIDADMADLAAVTLLVSVRDNDLKGRSSNDLTQLSAVHGDPDSQDEHCLRSKVEDEPGGSEAALSDCRAFIRGKVLDALDGLDANGVPDPAVRTSLPLHLSRRGSIDASLPTYYVRIGQAIHAVQDSFTHTYRTADGMKVTVVLNWVDTVDGPWTSRVTARHTPPSWMSATTPTSCGRRGAGWRPRRRPRSWARRSTRRRQRWRKWRR